MNMYDAERTRVTASSPWLRIHEFITAEPTTEILVSIALRGHTRSSPKVFSGETRGL